MLKLLTSISISLILFSCIKSNVQERIEIPTEIIKTIHYDIVYSLLDQALFIDSLEFNEGVPLVYAKAGYFLNPKEKNAVVISNSTDSTYFVDIYTQKDSTWIKNDSIDNLSARVVFFNVTYEDFNFDNQKDIYIQVSVSDGYVVSRGHLITIDPKTKKMTLHKEAEGLGNITPDKKVKTVSSQDIIFCESSRQWKHQTTIHRWERGILVKVKTDQPC